MSVLKVCIHTHPFTTATYNPMERVNVDTIGPFETDDNKNTYIITIIDCFTRWVELYATQDASARSAAEALLTHMGRYGIPNQILSDNGTQYVNDTIKEFTKLVGTEHVRTLAYSKQENAIVERVQKEALRHLRAIIFDENIVHRWSTCIPFVQRIINASTESSIGTSPASLLFGNSINLDRGIFMPLDEEVPAELGLHQWADSKLAAQMAVMKIAQKNQINKDNAHMLAGDVIQTEFPDGSYVLVEYPASNMKKGPPNKLNTYLRGPLRVLHHRGAAYTLQNLVTNKHETIHVSLLREFKYDPENINPIDIANRDAFATVVEAIISHTPVKNNYQGTKRSEFQFRVRWLGLSPEYDRYLPYSELRNNPRLHDYLNTNNMRTFVPTEHK
jgi:transposase InsO family protein